MLLTPRPSRRLRLTVQRLEPVVLERMRLNGMQFLSCHNNAKTWCEVLPPEWRARVVEGTAVLTRPIWHEAFGQWMDRVPHVWVEVRDGGRTVKLDGSVAQFKGQIPTYSTI